jgi:hypothetical protein
MDERGCPFKDQVIQLIIKVRRWINLNKIIKLFLEYDDTIDQITGLGSLVVSLENFVNIWSLSPNFFGLLTICRETSVIDAMIARSSDEHPTVLSTCIILVKELKTV